MIMRCMVGVNSTDARLGQKGKSAMTTVATKQQQPLRSTIPARLDRLRWSPFHTRLVLHAAARQ